SSVRVTGTMAETLTMAAPARIATHSPCCNFEGWELPAALSHAPNATAASSGSASREPLVAEPVSTVGSVRRAKPIASLTKFALMAALDRPQGNCPWVAGPPVDPGAAEPAATDTRRSYR